jgi:O-antigen ligase
MTSFMGVLVLALTQSRGGMIGFAAAMVVVFLVLPRRLRLATIVVGIVLIGAISLTPAGQSQIQRFGNVLDSTPAPSGTANDFDTGRSSVWGAAVRMFEDEPWTGVGAGEFDYHYREYTPVWYERFPLGQAHNGWLQMAAQSGIAGVIAFTGWVTATLVSLLGASRRSTEPLSRALAMGALAVMVAFTVHNLVDYLNVLSLGLQLGAVTAIGLNLAPDPCPLANVRPGPDDAPHAVIDTLHTGLV